MNTTTDHPRIRGEHTIDDRRRILTNGSSPHTRGALHARTGHRLISWIIPAYAGSTPTEAKASPRRSGSSPHTRGALAKRNAAADWGRIIPAYAGSTQARSASPWRWRDHPRIRGEHVLLSLSPRRQRGSSPHTRGALPCRTGRTGVWRIIPAYAGSTSPVAGHRAGGRDHPRIRGEHCTPGNWVRARSGSSPHTRGARHRPAPAPRRGRIIPAYAGSTAQYGQCPAAARDHPRIRGEHEEAMTLEDVLEGSSPHTRGAPRRRRPRGGPGRIIPAYAGSTRSCLARPARCRDHPRIRGEHRWPSLHSSE
mgnify:CR=1 FL=1